MLWQAFIPSRSKWNFLLLILIGPAVIRTALVYYEFNYSEMYDQRQIDEARFYVNRLSQMRLLQLGQIIIPQLLLLDESFS